MVATILTNLDGVLQARDCMKEAFCLSQLSFQMGNCPHCGGVWEVGREDQHPEADGNLYLSIMEQWSKTVIIVHVDGALAVCQALSRCCCFPIANTPGRRHLPVLLAGCRA